MMCYMRMVNVRFFLFMALSVASFSSVAKDKDASRCVCEIAGTKRILPDIFCKKIDDFGCKNRVKIENAFLNRIILSGPPGAGKTEMAKEFARQTDSKVFEYSCASMVTSFQGSGSENIKKIFAAANEYIQLTGRTAVIIFNEIDAIAQLNQNASKDYIGAYQELNTALDDHKNNPKLFFIGTSNRFNECAKEFQSRFDVIYINQPTLAEKKEILKSLILDTAKIIVQQADLKGIAEDMQVIKMPSLHDSFTKLKNVQIALTTKICALNQKHYEKAAVEDIKALVTQGQSLINTIQSASKNSNNDQLTALIGKSTYLFSAAAMHINLYTLAVANDAYLNVPLEKTKERSIRFLGSFTECLLMEAEYGELNEPVVMLALRKAQELHVETGPLEPWISNEALNTTCQVATAGTSVLTTAYTIANVNAAAPAAVGATQAIAALVNGTVISGTTVSATTTGGKIVFVKLASSTAAATTGSVLIPVVVAAVAVGTTSYTIYKIYQWYTAKPA